MQEDCTDVVADLELIVRMTRDVSLRWQNKGYCYYVRYVCHCLNANIYQFCIKTPTLIAVDIKYNTTPQTKSNLRK